MTKIEIVEAILKYFETGTRPTNKTGMPLAVFDNIDQLSEDKYLTQYKNYLEFVLPLLQRTTVRDTGDKPELKGL